MARSATDALGYFPALYTGVTTRVADSIAGGGFDDGPRMDDLATTFAAYYLRAWPSATGRPQCWQACWNVAGDGDLLIVQHLLLGINAHVNHDLPMAVVDVARGVGDLAAIRGDFDAINDVLAADLTTTLSQLDRVARWTNQAALLGAGRLFNFSLQVARRQAWAAAERLYAMNDPTAETAYAAELDRLVSVVAYLIVRPSPMLRPLLWLARRTEEHDPRKVTAALLS